MPRSIQAASVTPAGPRRWAAGFELGEHRQQLSATTPSVRGRLRRDEHAAVVEGQRLTPVDGVRGQVGGPDRRAERGQRARLALAEIALVERVEAIPGEPLERRRQGGQADPLAGAPGPAGRRSDLEKPASTRSVAATSRGGGFDRLDEAVPGREPRPGARWPAPGRHRATVGRSVDAPLPRSEPPRHRDECRPRSGTVRRPACLSASALAAAGALPEPLSAS